MSDIFISYAHEDRDRVKPLAEVLAAQGWSLWWDPDIPVSKRFDQVIKEALSEARCVVVAWSNISIDSHYVLDEAESGRKRGVLFPVLLDPPHDYLPPLGFRHIQWADLQDWDGTDTYPVFQKLISNISSVLGPAPVLLEEGKETKLLAPEEQPTREPVKDDVEEIPVQAEQLQSTADSVSNILGPAPILPETEKEVKPPAPGEQPTRESVKHGPEEIPLPSQQLTSTSRFSVVLTKAGNIGMYIGIIICMFIGAAIGEAIGKSDGWMTLGGVAGIFIGMFAGMAIAHAIGRAK